MKSTSIGEVALAAKRLTPTLSSDLAGVVRVVVREAQGLYPDWEVGVLIQDANRYGVTELCKHVLIIEAKRLKRRLGLFPTTEKKRLFFITDKVANQVYYAVYDERLRQVASAELVRYERQTGVTATDSV